MLPGVEPGLVRVGGQLDAACLAPASDLDLCLDDDRVAGGIRLRHRFVHRVGHPSG